MRLKTLFCALLTLPAAAQNVPSPQIPLTGNVGIIGSPILNSGTFQMPADADVTLAISNVNTSAFSIKITSAVSLTATRNIIYPGGRFTLNVENATTGGQSIQIIGTSGSGVTIPNGITVGVWNDGTNFVQIGAAGSGTGCIPSGSTNVLLKNGGSGTCVPSSVTDNGTTVSTTEPVTAPSLTTGNILLNTNGFNVGTGDFTFSNYANLFLGAGNVNVATGGNFSVDGAIHTSTLSGCLSADATTHLVSGSGSACGSGGSGSNVTINGGSTLSTANFNGTTPTAGSGFQNSTFQVSGNNVSIENPLASSSVFGLAKVDGTTIGASGGVLSALGAPPTGAAGGALAGTYPNPTISGLGAQYLLPVSDGAGHLAASNILTDATGKNLSNAAGKLTFQYFWSNPDNLTPALDTTESMFIANTAYDWTELELLNTACGTGSDNPGSTIYESTGNTENALIFGHLSPCSNTSAPGAADTTFFMNTGAAHKQYGTTFAPITNVSLTGNVVTLTEANSFTSGQFILNAGLTAATFLNGQTATIITASSTQITFAFPHANFSSTAETGATEAIVDNVMRFSTEGTGQINFGSGPNDYFSIRTGLSPNGIFFPSLTSIPCLGTDSNGKLGSGTCGGGAVSSVSNSDGTLTITPTTGAVFASLNLANANTWSASQTNTAKWIGTLPGSSAQGAFAVGTLPYSDTGIGLSIAGNTNSYIQGLINNANAGTTASACWEVGSDTTTAGSNYGELCRNSSGFSGTGFSTASAVTSDSYGGDYFFGTGTANGVHLLYNNTELMNANANGVSFPAVTTTPSSTVAFCPSGTGGALGLCAISGGTPAYPLTITGGVSGGVVYGSSATQLTVSPAGTAGAVMAWGGAGTAPGSTSASDNTTNFIITEPTITNLQTPSLTTGMTIQSFGNGNFSANSSELTIGSNMVPSAGTFSPKAVTVVGRTSFVGTATGSWTGLNLGWNFGSSSSNNLYTATTPMAELSLTPTINVETTSTGHYSLIYALPVLTSVPSVTNYDIEMPNFTVTAGGLLGAVQLSGLGSTPTIAVGAGAGSGATASVTGNNIDGVVTLSSGTSTTASATLATITFSGTLPATPAGGCTIMPRNANAVGQVLMVYSTSPSTTSWTIAVAGSAIPASITSYLWSYHCE
jgi:hypothetical protein